MANNENSLENLSEAVASESAEQTSRSRDPNWDWAQNYNLIQLYSQGENPYKIAEKLEQEMKVPNLVSKVKNDVGVLRRKIDSLKKSILDKPFKEKPAPKAKRGDSKDEIARAQAAHVAKMTRERKEYENAQELLRKIDSKNFSLSCGSRIFCADVASVYCRA